MMIFEPSGAPLKRVFSSQENYSASIHLSKAVQVIYFGSIFWCRFVNLISTNSLFLLCPYAITITALLDALLVLSAY